MLQSRKQRSAANIAQVSAASVAQADTMEDMQNRMMAEDIAANGGAPAGVVGPRVAASTRRHPMAPGRRGARQMAAGEYSPGDSLHEYQKRRVYDNSGADGSTHRALHTEGVHPNPARPYGFQDHYLELDSFSKNLVDSDAAKGIYAFNLMQAGDTGDNYIGVKGDLVSVTEVQIHEVCLPVPPLLAAPADNVTFGQGGLPVLIEEDSVTADPLDGQVSQTPFCRRVGLRIKQLDHQAIMGRGGRKRHFELEAAVAPSGDRWVLTPIDESEVFVLNKPMVHLSEFTLQFTNPDAPLTLPEDIIDAQLVAVASPALLGNPVHVVLRFVAPHGLVAGDRIYITGGIRAALPGADVINSYLPRAEGHIVSGGLNTGINPTTTEVALNPSIDAVITGAVDGDIIGNVTVRIAKNRMRMRMRVRGVAEGVTNYTVSVR